MEESVDKAKALTIPGDKIIADIAGELKNEIYDKCARLVERELGLPKDGSEEWGNWFPTLTPEEQRKTQSAIHLTRLRVLKAARVDLERAVVAARKVPVTWQQIGDAIGMTRSAAHDRWGAAAHRQAQTDKATGHVLDWALIKAEERARGIRDDDLR